MSLLTNYAKALIETWEEASEKDRPHIVDRFVSFLKAEGLERITSDVVRAVERELRDRDARRQSIVEVAHEGAITKKSFEALAVDEVHLSDTIIGGFRVRREQEVIDASVAGGLAQVRRALAST